MRYGSYRVFLISAMSVTCVGCFRSNDQEIVALRAELATAQAKITELKAEVARNKGGGNPNDAQQQPMKLKSRLVVVRGLKVGWEYPVYEGKNVLGRADQQPVDIDLQPQEREDRVWSSRQHAVIICKAGNMVIEDLNSANGTYVNGKRVPPGEQRKLEKNDIIQIGEVQIKVLE